MSDSPLLELADYLQRQADLYGPTKDSDRHHRDWAATRTRQAAILRAADAVIEAVYWKEADGQTQCSQCGRYNGSHTEGCKVAAYEAACRQGKEHE